MKKLAILLCIFISIHSKAQNIKGLVINQKDTSPVSFANVALLHLPDSAINSSGITLSDGGYVFEKVNPGNYLVKVSYVGLGIGVKNVEVKAGNNEILVDTIFMAESNQSLSEVTITGMRLQGKELVDRTVYTIPEAVAKASANGYDILKKIPQVQVDFQNNVTLNGTNNFIIQVDGKQRDKEFLAKLMPSDIESIEIISNPSGKYEGNIDGVINIVLKKEARFGLSGSASTYFKPINKPTAVASGTLEYGMGKISFYVTAFTFIQKLTLNSNTLDSVFLRTSGAPNGILRRDSINNMMGLGNLQVSSTSVNTGFDYYMNDKNTLSFNVNYKPIGQKVDMNSESTLDGRNFHNYMTGTANTEMNSDEGSVSLFYKRTFKKAVQEFSAEATYYKFRSADEKDYSNSYYRAFVDTFLYSYNPFESNINNRSYLSTKLNYAHPIGMTTKIEAGYQLYYQEMDFDFEHTINNNVKNNQYNYSEVRNAAYAGVTFNLKKFGFQSNIRIENTSNDINSDTTSHYYCVLPSVNIQYKFSPTQNIKFTYNRRINRPGVYDLNPFRKINPDLSINMGNAELEPEYRNRFQFTYSLNFGKNYCSPYVYYEVITNKIGVRNTDELSDGKTIKISMPDNLLTGNEKGAGLNANLWFVNINARYFNGHFNEFIGTTPAQSIAARDYSSYSITSYAYAQYPKKAKLTEFMFFSFNGVSVNSQSKTYSMPFYGFGAQKEAGNHNIGFFYLLPLSRNIEFSKTITRADNFYSDARIGFDVSYYIQIMYTYKFNKGRSVKKLNRKVDIESDSKSEGIGSK